MKMYFQVRPNPDTGGWRKLEYDLGRAFQNGVRKHGWDVTLSEDVPDVSKFDIIGFVGVKKSELAAKCDAAGVPYIYFDKAYNRNPDWWKISYGSHQPTKFLGRLNMPEDRRLAEGWNFKGWRKPTATGHVLIAGSSLKYHVYHNLAHPTEFWQDVVDRLHKLTKREVLYRPKKSWHEAKPLPGSAFSTEIGIRADLRGAHAMVTYGSNAVMEAVFDGVPTICLGEAVLAPISSRTLEEVNNPREASVEEVHSLLNDLAYCQWSVSEINDGKFWGMLDGSIQISKTLQGTAPGKPEVV